MGRSSSHLASAQEIRKIVERVPSFLLATVARESAIDDVSTTAEESSTIITHNYGGSVKQLYFQAF